MTLDEIRAAFPVFERFTYMNHSSTAPLAVPVQRAISQAATLQENGSEGSAQLKARIQPLKEKIARLIGASPDEIALVRNTTDGLNIIANGVTWKAGENIVTDDMEFPANIYPWLNQGSRYGVETRMVPCRDGKVLADDLIKSCDARTRLVTVSFVQFYNGYRVDLERLGAFCRERGIYLCVDGIQGLGPVEIDVRRCHIDFLAAGAHKWLLGPMGIGFLYVRKELQQHIWPAAVSHFGIVQAPDSLLKYDLVFRPTAEKFEGGLPNYAGIFGFDEALGLLNDVGLPTIRDRVLTLSDYLCDGIRHRNYRLLSHRGPTEKSATVTFASEQHSSQRLHSLLKDAGVVVSLRENAIRVSPYFYNTFEDIDRLLSALPR